MLRIFGLVTMVAAALMLAPAAFAKHGHHHYGHAHWNKHHDWDRGRVNWNAPFRGRYWGGRWWGYGEDACWRWKHGGYIWICR
jgi:hypothetical protein